MPKDADDRQVQLHRKPEQKTRSLTIRAGLGYYGRRRRIAYSQHRPTDLRWPRFVRRMDCSGLVAACMHRAKVLPNVDWRWTNTWTQIRLGRPVDLADFELVVPVNSWGNFAYWTGGSSKGTCVAPTAASDDPLVYGPTWTGTQAVAEAVILRNVLGGVASTENDEHTNDPLAAGLGLVVKQPDGTQYQACVAVNEDGSFFQSRQHGLCSKVTASGDAHVADVLIENSNFTLKTVDDDDTPGDGNYHLLTSPAPTGQIYRAGHQ